MRQGHIAFPILVLSLCLPSLALAGGFEVGDNGTRSLGRAGAYVASVDEPSALYYNPAALTRIEGSAITLNLSLLNQSTRFERAPFTYAAGRNSTYEIQFDPVEQEIPVFPEPMIFYGSNFGLRNWSFGAGLYGPPAFGVSRYPEMQRRTGTDDSDPCGVYLPCRNEPTITRDGGQAYMMTDRNIILVYPSIAVAYRIEPANLSLGVTAQLPVIFTQFGVGVEGQGSQTSEVEFLSTERDDFYAHTDLNVSGLTGTAIIGLLWEPHPRVAIGASYRPRFRYSATGTMDVTFPPALSQIELELSDNSATLHLVMPDVVRAGVVYNHLNAAGRQLFNLEANVVWENWSLLEAFEVDVPGALSDNAGTLDGRRIPYLKLPHHYQDSWAFRLGADITALLDEEGVGPVFRLGGSYETPTSPVEWTNIDFLPFERYGITLGFSWHLRNWTIDTAYAFYGSPERVVENGKYELLIPLWVCENPPDEATTQACAQPGLSPGHAINNGTYNTRTQIFSMGATYAW